MRVVLEEKRSEKRSEKYPRVASVDTPVGHRTLHIDFRREGGYYNSPSNAPKWWNWQTRHLEGVVGKPVRVQIPPSAPSFAPHRNRTPGISKLRMASHPERRMSFVAPAMGSHSCKGRSRTFSLKGISALRRGPLFRENGPSGYFVARVWESAIDRRSMSL
jgi:hypothetical protein